MDHEIDKQDARSTEGGEMKIGDKLILRHSRYAEILEVDSITKTGRIRAGGYEFNKDLSKRGRGYGQAEVATQEKLDEIAQERKVAKARSSLQGVVWWQVPDSVVLATAEAYGLAMEKHNKEIEVQGE
jgi:hypothetical protein